jgi:hypothetical protein
VLILPGRQVGSGLNRRCRGVSDSRSKAAEVIDYAISVRAAHTYQIHDSLVTGNYATIVEGHLQRIAGPYGVEFRHLAARENVRL